jgi:predicted rRNA methylase YqxC with S4 and FtsJ domains
MRVVLECRRLDNGFTEILSRGAAKVFTVDVGQGARYAKVAADLAS